MLAKAVFEEALSGRGLSSRIRIAASEVLTTTGSEGDVHDVDPWLAVPLDSPSTTLAIYYSAMYITAL
jgi:hypothetical protein